MKILLTNHHLNLLGGSETFTYTLAHALRNAGHDVTLLTAETGTVAKRMKQEGFFVTYNPVDLKDHRFDVAHIHHNAMAVLVRYIWPDLPMVFLSHGIVPGLEEPPSTPCGIGRYLAVSEEVLANLQSNYGITNAEIIRNGVDSQRFKPIQPINESLQNILVLSNHFPPEKLTIVQQAAEKIGAKVNTTGMATGSVWETEQVINEADLVISLGRGALEAMSCGRAVLIFDWHGGDGMITAESYPEIRLHNFSGRRYRNEYSVEQMLEELARYSPEMGKINRQIVQENHDISEQIADYEVVYQRAISSDAHTQATISAGREIIFYQNAWRERVQLWNRLVKTSEENDRLKQELSALQQNVRKVMIKVDKERKQWQKNGAVIPDTKTENTPITELIKRHPANNDLHNFDGSNMIFVFGPPRSGTTWLFSLLSEHPDVVAATAENLDLNLDSDTLETGIFANQKLIVDLKIKQKFFALSEKSPDKYIVEKTPVHVMQADRIAHVFPESAFILIERDGRDVVNSMLHAGRMKDSWWKGAPSTMKEAAEMWSEYVDACEQCKESQNTYVIRFEDLKTNTLVELAALTKLLGLNVDHLQNQIEKSRDGKNIPIKGVFRKGVVGDWKTEFSNVEKDIFKEIAGDKLIKLGYVSGNDW